MKKATSGILIILLCAAFGYGEIQLKFSGGVNWISGSDFNAFARGQNTLFAQWYTNIQGNRTEFGSAPLFQAEAVSYFSPSLGVGLGLGAFGMSRNDKVAFTWSNEPGEIQYRSKLTVVPVTLSLHYRSRMADRLTLNGHAGLGVYLSRLDIFERHFFQSGPHHYTSDFKGDVRGTFGLQAGVGLEYELSSRLAVFISGGLRVASYRPISGQATTNLDDPSVSWSDLHQSGNYYFFDYYSYPYMVFGQTAPVPDSEISNVRKADINLTGAIITMGVRIKI